MLEDQVAGNFSSFNEINIDQASISNGMPREGFPNKDFKNLIFELRDILN